MQWWLGIFAVVLAAGLFRWGNAPGCIGVAIAVLSWLHGYIERQRDERRGL